MSRLEKRTSQAWVTPQSTAKINLTIDQLAALPKGALFQNKQGNATATAQVTDDGNIEITANCDSLTLLVESLEIEVHHLRDTNTALVTKLKQKETVGLRNVDVFQIYGFRVLVGLIAAYIIYRKLKAKIKWQKKN